MQLQLPINLVFNYIDDPVSRKVYSLLAGLALQMFMFREEIVHTIIMTTVSYMLMLSLPRLVQHKVICVFAFLYLSFIHLKRMYYDYGGWTIDYSCYGMILSLKLCSMAVSYRDGSPSIKDPRNSLHKHELELRQVKTPSFLDVYSFAFSCTGCIVGPYYEYTDYINFVNKEGRYKNIPKTFKIGIQYYLLAMVLMGIYVVATLIWPTSAIYLPEFANWNYLYKMWYVSAAMFARRFQFYSVFRFMELATNSSGLGYNGKSSNEEQWDTAVGGYGWNTESTANPQVVFKNWNYHIHIFMKKYIFLRQLKKGQRPPFFANLSTMMVSAFWHGFYPTYYWTFFCTTFYIELSKDFVKLQPVWDYILPSITTQWLIAYIGHRFLISYLLVIHFSLFWNDVIFIIKAFYYLPYIFIFGLFLFFRLTNIPNKIQRKYGKNRTTQYRKNQEAHRDTAGEKSSKQD